MHNTVNNVIWHKSLIAREDRERQNRHKGAILWFTGLSGSGKSTLAHHVEKKLFDMDCRTFVFDGDNVRHGLCRDLGFSETDRSENIRRIGEMTKLFIEAGIIALTAFISPFRNDRNSIRALVLPNDFHEIYCECPLEICESRDVKGLYKKARLGLIPNFTGISSPYEEPVSPELIINTGSESLESCSEKVISYLFEKSIISRH